MVPRRFVHPVQQVLDAGTQLGRAVQSVISLDTGGPSQSPSRQDGPFSASSISLAFGFSEALTWNTVQLSWLNPHPPPLTRPVSSVQKCWKGRKSMSVNRWHSTVVECAVSTHTCARTHVWASLQSWGGNRWLLIPRDKWGNCPDGSRWLSWEPGPEALSLDPRWVHLSSLRTRSSFSGFPMITPLHNQLWGGDGGGDAQKRTAPRGHSNLGKTCWDWRVGWPKDTHRWAWVIFL